MKVYLALIRPKLKRGAEWKLTTVNGLFTLLMPCHRPDDPCMVGAQCRSIFLLARSVDIAPGREARPAVACGLRPFTAASADPGAARLRSHTGRQASPDNSSISEMGEIKEGAS